MMPVILASLREGLAIRLVQSPVEHVGIVAVASNTVAFQVGNVSG
jgi:hypothetical protein